MACLYELATLAAMHLDELGSVREATSEIYAPRRQIGFVSLGQGCGGFVVGVLSHLSGPFSPPAMI